MQRRERPGVPPRQAAVVSTEGGRAVHARPLSISPASVKAVHDLPRAVASVVNDGVYRAEDSGAVAEFTSDYGDILGRAWLRTSPYDAADARRQDVATTGQRAADHDSGGVDDARDVGEHAADGLPGIVDDATHAGVVCRQQRQ